MYILLIFVHILVCFGLMVSILLQSGKGGSLAGAFGVGGGSQTLFGGRGAATFLTRATQWLGAVFFITSMSLAWLSHANTSTTGSLIQQEARRGGQKAAAPSQRPATGPGASVPIPAGAQPAKAPAGGAPPAPTGK